MVRQISAPRKQRTRQHVIADLSVQAARRPRKGAKTVRVRVAGRQLVNRRAIAKMRELKNNVYIRVIGRES